MLKTIELDNFAVNQEMRISAIQSIIARYPHIKESYLSQCFDKYPKVVFIQQKEQFVGMFFYNFFDKDNRGFFYFGPIFFFTRAAFAWGGSKIVRAYLKRYPRVYFLAEVQNPELIIHLQTVFKSTIHPEPFTFVISEHAKKNLRTFKENTPQLDAICEKTFCSQSHHSFFYPNRKANLMTRWLARNGIALDKNQALVVLIDLTYSKFLLTQINILYRYLVYPSHRVSYLNTIEHLLREPHDHSSLKSAYSEENS